MGTGGHRPQRRTTHDQLGSVDVREQVGEIGLAPTELGHRGYPLGQAVHRAHPGGEAIHVEPLVRSHVDEVTHRRRGYRNAWIRHGLASTAMPTLFEISDRFTDEFAELMPIAATTL